MRAGLRGCWQARDERNRERGARHARIRATRAGPRGWARARGRGAAGRRARWVREQAHAEQRANRAKQAGDTEKSQTCNKEEGARKKPLSGREEPYGRVRRRPWRKSTARSKVALQRPPQYACGCLFILSEVLKAKSPLWGIVLQNESVDDGDEHFDDILESPEDSSIASAVLEKHNEKVAAHEKHNIDAADGIDSIKQVKLVDENNASVDASRQHTLYDPRHREPSYCNADRVSWWELTVLASHVHPSVSTMARTLLSGNNIVYSGDPLTDLSLPAFLDKFMEKKPKGNRIAEGRWHGGSQIAPAKKLNLNHHLIGEELLELAENEVPPEDIVFHRFYLNKSGPVKPKAKRKDSVLDEDAGELLADNNADDASDESGDEMQDLGDGLTDDGEYDYDDLDSNAFEEEKDLLRDDSDVELDDISDDTASRDAESEDDDDISSLVALDAEALVSADDSDGNLSDHEMVDAGKGGGSYTDKKGAGRKHKRGVKSGASPFASLEDYEHLMDGDADATTAKLKHKASGRAGGEKKPKLRSRKKRSRSSE